MDLIKKNFLMVTNFIIVCILCIFNVLIADCVGNTLSKNFGRDAYYTDWKAIIIVFLCLILFVAVISLLFSANQNEKVKKQIQTILLFVSVVITLVTLLLFVVVTYKIYNHSYLLSIGEEITTKQGNDYIVNMAYQDSFLILAITSFFNLIEPIIALKFCEKEGEENNEDSEEYEETVNQENKIVKKEIAKLKQQLELEDLKQEYESLYKNLTDKIKTENDKNKEKPNEEKKIEDKKIETTNKKDEK